MGESILTMRRFGVLIPFYSLIPVGLGVAAFWAFIVLIGAFRFMNCPDWTLLSPAPVNATGITGYYKNVVYLQLQDGTLSCNAQNGWQKCPPPPIAWEHEDAPDWVITHFEVIPNNNSLIKQETRFVPLVEIRYYALLDNGQVLQCSTTWTAEVRNILYSREILWLLLLVGIIIFSGGWFLKIVIEEGAPVLSDWFGNIKRIK